MPTDRLVWVDLEMTGLDPDADRILEAAVIITDGQLEILAEGPNLVLHQSDELLSSMDAWNQKHHGESGLVERVRASSLSETDAEAQLLDFVRSFVGERQAPLAGNSVHQDRRFLARYMPTFERHLHYRNVDVSTVKELLQRWSPDAYAGRPNKRGGHRALNDIRESIAELAYYRKAAFR